MNSLSQDLRFALRGFARDPGFTAAAVLSLAIGVGANTAIFSVTSALLLNPLPYQDAGRLVILWNRSPGLGITEDWFSTAQYFDIQRGHQGFEQVAIAYGANDNLTGDGEPERVGAIRVSSNVLPMLGAQPAIGRLFTPQDDVPGAAGVAVLTHGTWQRRYGGDPRTLGKSILMNGRPYQVVGVLAASFALKREVMPTLYGADAEVFLPLQLGPDAAQIRTREDYNILGKLRPGVTVEQAQSEMDALTARLRREHPEVYPPNGGLTFSIVPLLEQVVGDSRRPLLILSGAVGLVLLIACANVANLTLSRALARKKEIAVRAALGAGRGRIVRQLLTESTLLALAGGALGLLLAAGSVAWVQTLGTRSVPRWGEIGIDGQVLAFTLLVSVASGILFGLVPAVRIGRLDVQESLQEAGRGSSAAGAVWSRGRNTRGLLVASELALAVVLLIGAGLFIRSFARVQGVRPGFNPHNVLTFELTMSGRRYGDAQNVLETYRQLWQRLASLPGVTAAGGVTSLPLSQMFAWGPITVEGRVPPPGEKFINADQRIVGGDYFRAMEIPLLQGRLFTEHDTRDQPRVCVVDEHMAEQLWLGESALGKRLRTGGAESKTPWITVVGVVGRVKQYTLDSGSRIAMYSPQTQYPARAMNVVLRSAADPVALARAAKREVRALDADLPVYNVKIMAERINESLARQRFSMVLLALFAGVALVLAAIGAYGVMAYLVSQGTRDLGIRIALGATPRDILLLVVRQGMAVALGGVAAGLLLALALGRAVRGLLFGVEATDPLTFTAIATLLSLVAFTASYIPARRAARIDPMVSLREE
jgi:predicted permease